MVFAAYTPARVASVRFLLPPMRQLVNRVTEGAELRARATEMSVGSCSDAMFLF